MNPSRNVEKGQAKYGGGKVMVYRPDFPYMENDYFSDWNHE